MAERRRGGEDSLGGVLDGLLAGRSLQSGLLVGRLARSWEEVMGERLAGESTPLRLDHAGTLFVRASSGAWASQIQFLAEEVAGRANSVLGGRPIRRVRVVLDGGRDGPARG